MLREALGQAGGSCGLQKSPLEGHSVEEDEVQHREAPVYSPREDGHDAEVEDPPSR